MALIADLKIWRRLKNWKNKYDVMLKCGDRGAIFALFMCGYEIFGCGVA
ncbi:hypothetical protein [Staphylococcus debuckii]|uniref:Holin n=1 Tax=Staphylococcus debuckii TaxID=2044912 RepID=A0ABU9EVN9_9STAP